MRASPLQSSFSEGEWSPLLKGRVESERYKNALAVCQNYVPLVQGPLTRRPGSYYVAEVKTSSAKTRLVPFEFSVTQAYILEFGNQYIRFYKDEGQIESGGSPYEISTPYTTADLFDLKFTQSADVLYITHPSYAPRKLTRTAHTAWTLTTITFLDGPYLATNTTAVTLALSGTSGSVTVTASSATFASTDVGRLIRWRDPANNWTWLTITAYTDTTHVTATISGPNASAGTATVNWRLGLYSATTGYPSCVVFHEDRLGFAGAGAAPQRFDLSNSSDYENFAPTAAAGTTAANYAIAFSLNANDVNVIRWMTSDEKGLLIGTVAGEWVARPSVQSEAMSPTNINAKKATSYGSDNIQAVQIGKATIFVQRAGKKFREMTYFYDADGFLAPDLTLLSEHITKSGVTQLAYMKEPFPILWAVRNDGALIGMSYERDLDSVKVGWHRHIIGGVSDAAGTDAIVESIAVIPSADATADTLWMIVKRRINGATKRYVEFLTPFFNQDIEQKDAFFVDCGLTYDDPKTITGISQAATAVVTSAAHGYSNGDLVLLSDILGMEELNGNTYTVANAAANTFELSGVDSSGYEAYVSGGEARKYVTNISGLSHLEGQTVSILADGAARPDATVSSGAITLTYRATTVQIGLGYESDGQILRVEAGAADGTALGKNRKISEVGIQFDRSLGLKIGIDFDNLDSIVFRETSDPLTRATALFTGIVRQTIESDFNFENQLCWRQAQPLPSTILSLSPQLVTQDLG